MAKRKNTGAWPQMVTRIFGALGVLTGSASLISLMQRWTGYELVSEIAADALSIYRQVLSRLKDVIFDSWLPLALPWGWQIHMPEWGMDILFAWLLFAAANLRAVPPTIRQVGVFSVKRPDGTTWSPTALDRVRREVGHVLVFVLFAPFVWFGFVSHMVATVLRLVFTPWRAREFTPWIRSDFWKNYAGAWAGLFFILLVLCAPFALAALFFLLDAIQLTPQ